MKLHVAIYAFAEKKPMTQAYFTRSHALAAALLLRAPWATGFRIVTHLDTKGRQFRLKINVPPASSVPNFNLVVECNTLAHTCFEAAWGALNKASPELCPAQ